MWIGWVLLGLSLGFAVIIAALAVFEVRLSSFEKSQKEKAMKVGGEAKPPRDVKCPHCGQVVPYDNNTCANCGKPLS
ncbi:MAG: zinc ribbon domain-containing protein [Dehalococcoidales bacterium]|nr:zinc ribbon domain-containing protein [Dehalococcoidales bacterium]